MIGIVVVIGQFVGLFGDGFGDFGVVIVDVYVVKVSKVVQQVVVVVVGDMYVFGGFDDVLCVFIVGELVKVG